MIKTLSLLTHLLFTISLVGCSNLEIDESISEDEITKDTHTFTDHTLTNQKASKRPEPSVLFNQPQPKVSTQDQLPYDKKLEELPSEDSTALFNKALEEKHYIETPTKDPTLGSQSSEHENEYRPKTLNQNTTKEDKHSETSATRPPAAKAQTSNTQASSAASKQNKPKKQNQQSAHKPSSSQKNTTNSPQNKRTIAKNNDSDLGTKKAQQQKIEAQTKKESTKGKENTLTTKKTNQGIKGDISEDTKQSNDTNPSTLNKNDHGHSAATNTDHNGRHAANNTHHHDQHPHSETEQDHPHALKKKTKRHWNMQRMIRPKATEP